MRQRRRIDIAIIAITMAALVALCVVGIASLPQRYRPLAPLDVRDQPVPVITSGKLARAGSNKRYCEAALDTTGFRLTPVPLLTSVNGRCAVQDAIRIERENALFSAGFSASCPLTLALALWIRHELQPAARRELGVEIVRINHSGSYACRRIRGGRGGDEDRPLSEHASANAIDITGFVLTDGRVIAVKDGWPREQRSQQRPINVSTEPAAAGVAGAPDAQARFLRQARDGACRYFHGVLGPDFNQAHHNHFHLDMGRWRMCQ